ncbi:MAG: ribonuclease III [Schleiferiaceae bacterium]|nr:ribonuclease III [Schleiferiaceae bacterium]
MIYFLKKIFNARLEKDGHFFLQLSKLLPAKPKNPLLYQLAFRHSSASLPKKSGMPLNNQRLEFLGDAVLSAVIAEMLYKKFPNKDEGFLTQMRTKLVSRKNLNQLAIAMKLDKLLIAKIDTNKTSEHIYGDALEALIGAIYLDLGLKKVTSFIEQHFSKDLELLEDIVVSYKSEVYEWAQNQRNKIEYQLLAEAGEQHSRSYTVGVFLNGALMAEGQASSKKKAAEKAAKVLHHIIHPPHAKTIASRDR